MTGIGGGHAGVEAALACARLHKKTILYSMHIDMIASMPCNPSVGGPAKGIVVREIDGLLVEKWEVDSCLKC